jgi:hypothetical protein
VPAELLENGSVAELPLELLPQPVSDNMNTGKRINAAL